MVNVMIVIGIAVLVIVSIRHIVKQHKQGGCGCGCSGCASAGICHTKQEEQHKH